MRLVEDWGFAESILRAFMPMLLQQTLTLNITGYGLLILFMFIGGYVGYLRGIRALSSIVLWTVVAYLLTVQGGNVIVDIINRIYTNIPRFIAVITGGEAGDVAPLDPLIIGFQIPLFFRILLFLAIIIIAFVTNKGSIWYGANPVGHEPLARPLGMFGGALIALLWTNAAAVFWGQYLADGGNPNLALLSPILSILPDVSSLILPIITIFFFIVGVTLLWILPRLFRVPPAPQKK